MSKKNYMCKQEAIEALSKGYKISHPTFLDSEYIYEKDSKIFTEEGYSISKVTFWNDRNSPNFQENWFLVNDVHFDNETQSLEIIFKDYGQDHTTRSDLFDFLGDFDIIQANELHENAIVWGDSVFLFDNQLESELVKNGIVKIPKDSDLLDFIDLDIPNHRGFMVWYNNEK